jgi:hypothetical protein
MQKVFREFIIAYFVFLILYEFFVQQIGYAGFNIPTAPNFSQIFPSAYQNYITAYNDLGGTWIPPLNSIHDFLAWILSYLLYIPEMVYFIGSSISYLISLFTMPFYILIYPLNYLIGILTTGVLIISFITSFQFVSSKIGG